MRHSPVLAAPAARPPRPRRARILRHLPAVACPLGGGLIKLGHGSTWAAVGVGVAPYAICALLYAVFVVGYLAAVLRYLCAGPAGQQAMERLITVSASAIVSVLTGRPPRSPGAGPARGFSYRGPACSGPRYEISRLTVKGNDERSER
jgi:hypothetical protein